jgi:hypothetical protein
VRGPPNAHVHPSHFDESSLGPIRSNQPSSFVVDQPGNPIRASLHQSMPIAAGARSSASAMPLPVLSPRDNPQATGKAATSQIPRPETMYEFASLNAAVVPNTSTTWGYVRDSGQSLPPLGSLNNGGLPLYYPDPPTAAVVPNSHFGYLGQNLSPLGPLSNGGLTLYHPAHPTVGVVPNNRFGYLGQNQSGGYTPGVESHRPFEKKTDHSRRSAPERSRAPRPGMMYHSAPPSPAMEPNGSTTWRYFGSPEPSLAPPDSSSNRGFTFFRRWRPG